MADQNKCNYTTPSAGTECKTEGCGQCKTARSDRAVEAPDAEKFSAPPATRGQNLAMLAAVIVPPIGCFVAMVVLWRVGWMGWSYLAMVLVGWVVTASGVTVGFHRLLCKRPPEPL